MKYYLSVVDPRTKQVERVRLESGQQILQVLQYVRRLGLTGTIIKAAHRWSYDYPVFYTLDGRCRVKKWVRFGRP